MENDLLTIGEAAAYLGVSVDTLRRWDKSGKLVAIKKEGGTHRYYRKGDLLTTRNDLLQLARNWVFANKAIPKEFYCPYSSVFQSRLISMQDRLIRIPSIGQRYSLIVATCIRS